MPSRYALPPDMEEAMMICEIGLPPQIINEWPQSLVDKILIYKGVKNVAQYGGDWQP